MSAKICDRLAGKLSRIKSGDYTPTDFIIADAKDADMGGGISGLGFTTGEGGIEEANTATDYRASVIDMMDSDLVDIMLTSM